jgi:Fe-S-cluster-containing hydrogenase component 2
VYRDHAVPVVRINEAECIGCWECIKACPFGAADWDDDKEVAIMCDLCGGEPACVASCIYGALSFEPEATVVRRKRRATAEAIASNCELRIANSERRATS